jgi:hypothetical protein
LPDRKLAFASFCDVAQAVKVVEAVGGVGGDARVIASSWDGVRVRYGKDRCAGGFRVRERRKPEMKAGGGGEDEEEEEEAQEVKGEDVGGSQSDGESLWDVDADDGGTGVSEHERDLGSLGGDGGADGGLEGLQVDGSV